MRKKDHEVSKERDANRFDWMKLHGYTPLRTHSHLTHDSNLDANEGVAASRFDWRHH